MSVKQPTIGSLLRSLRARNDWTLKEMSERCGIPLSTLSKVEHDRLTLTYDKLQQLSQRLNLRMSELFAENDEPATPMVTARRSIGRIEDAARFSTPNYDYYFMCAELRHKRMIPIVTRVRAKSLDEFGQLERHSGEEYIYVLQGRAEIHTEFYDTVVLEAGQSAYIDSNMGHAYTAAEGCDEVLLLGICSSADENLVESLMTLRGIDAPATTKPARPTAPARKRKSGAGATPLSGAGKKS